jgi:hypothetical protein
MPQTDTRLISYDFSKILEIWVKAENFQHLDFLIVKLPNVYLFAPFTRIVSFDWH